MIDAVFFDEPYNERQVIFVCTSCECGFGGVNLERIIDSFKFCPYCGISLKKEEKEE